MRLEGKTKMKHEMKKVSKIIDEITTYTLKNGATEIDIKIKNTPDYFKLRFEIKNFTLSKDEYYNLLKALQSPRQMEIEEYCWELAGENDIDMGINLIGSMTDDANVEINGETTIIELFRYKK